MGLVVRQRESGQACHGDGGDERRDPHGGVAEVGRIALGVLTRSTSHIPSSSCWPYEHGDVDAEAAEYGQRICGEALRADELTVKHERESEARSINRHADAKQAYPAATRALEAARILDECAEGEHDERITVGKDSQACDAAKGERRYRDRPCVVRRSLRKAGASSTDKAATARSRSTASNSRSAPK